MDKKITFGLTKKITAGVMAVGIILVGMVFLTKNTDAAEDKIIYDDSYDITKYWSVDSKTAPVKEGYVFGGWYADEQGDDYLTESEAAEAVSAYAKFVPAQVLSVKAQNEAGVDADTEKTYVRVVSSLDSTKYKKVGFDIWLANRTQLYKDSAERTPLETNKIYTGLMVGNEAVDAKDIFGGVSEYVSVWQLTNVANSNYGKIIYVRPYWITMDGTKVDGIAKYVHVEDQYKGYISVPVNLLGGEQMAAGAVNMTYDNGDSAELELVEFEAGRILTEMSYTYNNKTIKMVGNIEANKEVGSYNEGETIYANLRFKKPSENTDFNITYGQFCDWSENLVDIEKAWDTKYVQ